MGNFFPSSFNAELAFSHSLPNILSLKIHIIKGVSHYTNTYFSYTLVLPDIISIPYSVPTAAFCYYQKLYIVTY